MHRSNAGDAAKGRRPVRGKAALLNRVDALARAGGQIGNEASEPTRRERRRTNKGCTGLIGQVDAIPAAYAQGFLGEGCRKIGAGIAESGNGITTAVAHHVNQATENVGVRTV